MKDRGADMQLTLRADKFQKQAEVYLIRCFRQTRRLRLPEEKIEDVSTVSIHGGETP